MPDEALGSTAGFSFFYLLILLNQKRVSQSKIVKLKGSLTIKNLNQFISKTRFWGFGNRWKIKRKIIIESLVFSSGITKHLTTDPSAGTMKFPGKSFLLRFPLWRVIKCY